MASQLTRSGLQPFRIAIAQDELELLSSRLQTSRFSPAMQRDADWFYGTDPAWLRELVSYWRDGFDWREVEFRLNGREQFTADVHGMRLHVVCCRSSRPGGTPIVLLHGWPGSFVQMLELADLLASPEGGGFDVVVPSLPGFGLSSVPVRMDVGAATADAIHALMTEVLGHPRYVVHGTDFGANIADHLAARHSGAVIALHVGGTSPREAEAPTDASAAEREYLSAVYEWRRTEVGYGAIQSTKPQSLAAALVDSPAGTAAWLAEKYRRWSDGDGEIGSFSRDQLLTVVSLYWFTGAIATSIRAYAQSDAEPDLRGSCVPIAYLMSSRDMLPTPREWVERRSRVDRWTAVDRGGHFIEWEQPELVANDIVEWMDDDRVSSRR